ncbi:MAG: hypothetical protein MUF54_19395, partial [Polyangiaceae bacterium]|nr:hypothetical protein [Polyangiaceae bacterium]
MRWTLRLTPDRWWVESEQLERDTGLVACVGEAGAWLIAVAVRKLVANAKRHADSDGEAEVRLDVEASTICILIPGPAFDSVTWARTYPGCFLARLNRMLDEDGVLWSWTAEAGSNRIDFSLGSSRIWVSVG